MKLKHKANHQLWAIGAIVIYDKSPISRDYLRVVVDKKDDVFFTKYLFPRKIWKRKHANTTKSYEEIQDRQRKIYEGTSECDIRELHYPGRFKAMKIDSSNSDRDLQPFYELGQAIIEDYQAKKVSILLNVLKDKFL